MVKGRWSPRWNEHWEFKAERGGKPGIRRRPSGSACSASFNLRMAMDAPLKLPASKKTRALLGYLIATGQPHRRELLCDLFWDGPDDPRAELRWSLSKIRPLLKKAVRSWLPTASGSASSSAMPPLISSRCAHSSVRELLSASTDALKQATSLFRGEFLDGLDLPACYRFQEWCMAEREAVSQLRLGVLAALIDRLEDQPARLCIMRAASRCRTRCPRQAMPRWCGCCGRSAANKKPSPTMSARGACSKRSWAFRLQRNWSRPARNCKRATIRPKVEVAATGRR